ncbi:MAG TPA: hypothetical protein VK274_06110, partial [Pyrinomonadaceae bacterium]|nr:hypothetical protein [Pyrinomonadaceae bacterium]
TDNGGRGKFCFNHDARLWQTRVGLSLGRRGAAKPIHDCNVTRTLEAVSCMKLVFSRDNSMDESPGTFKREQGDASPREVLANL